LTDSLDVNDKWKRPLADLKRHFCAAYGESIQMHTIHESNYTVINLPLNGNNKAKKNNKTQFSL